MICFGQAVTSYTLFRCISSFYYVLDDFPCAFYSIQSTYRSWEQEKLLSNKLSNKTDILQNSKFKVTWYKPNIKGRDVSVTCAFRVYLMDFNCLLICHVLHWCLYWAVPCSMCVPQVRVVIVDENDCVPEFLQSIYSKDGVPETVTTATSLLQGEIISWKYLCSILFGSTVTCTTIWLF